VQPVRARSEVPPAQRCREPSQRHQRSPGPALPASRQHFRGAFAGGGRPPWMAQFPGPSSVGSVHPATAVFDSGVDEAQQTACGTAKATSGSIEMILPGTHRVTPGGDVADRHRAVVPGRRKAPRGGPAPT
jgi:hypothetical protein